MNKRSSWNKGLKCFVERCRKCGIFVKKNKIHNCKSVDLKGKRFCIECGIQLKNYNWERYSKICGKCGKIKMRKKEKELKIELKKMFGGKCEICKYDKFFECLEFHHLSKEEKNGKHFLKQIIQNPEKFRLLCNRCHREVEIEAKIIVKKQKG